MGLAEVSWTHSRLGARRLCLSTPVTHTCLHLPHSSSHTPAKFLTLHQRTYSTLLMPHIKHPSNKTQTYTHTLEAIHHFNTPMTHTNTQYTIATFTSTSPPNHGTISYSSGGGEKPHVITFPPADDRYLIRRQAKLHDRKERSSSHLVLVWLPYLSLRPTPVPHFTLPPHNVIDPCMPRF